jgi:hypothetical protein
VKDLCERCVVCRRAKIRPQIAASLYPLPVPPRPWHTVGLDYLTHLPESNGFNSVLIVVDHLTRMTHFLPYTETVTAEEAATLFLQGVYRLHGLHRVLVSDRDPKFVSAFWLNLWRRLRTTEHRAFEKNNFCAVPAPRSPAQPVRYVFSRTDTPKYSPTLRGGACPTAAFDGEEGTAGSAVGGGCWSWWWPAGKQRLERALASRRPAMCQSNLAER